MTLVRYARPLQDPALLMRRLDAGAQIDVAVRVVLVVRERVFPSLDYDVLHRTSLAE